MKIVNLKDEDFINYRETSMFIGLPFCSGKCWRELGLDSSMCQNDKLRESNLIDVSNKYIIDRYLNNPITKAIVFGGMEPFDSKSELISFIEDFREVCSDPVIIYTGYTKEEVSENLKCIFDYNNLIIKFGRFIPGQQKHYDKILGVNLASDNQYAEKIN